MATYNNKNSRSSIKPVEARFNRAVTQLRTLRVSTDTIEIQKELSWLKKEIEDYGFVFFANFYVYDKVAEFEKQVAMLAADSSTKKQTTK